jgi:hypothetical protein
MKRYFEMIPLLVGLVVAPAGCMSGSVGDGTVGDTQSGLQSIVVSASEQTRERFGIAYYVVNGDGSATAFDEVGSEKGRIEFGQASTKGGTITVRSGDATTTIDYVVNNQSSGAVTVLGSANGNAFHLDLANDGEKVIDSELTINSQSLELSQSLADDLGRYVTAHGRIHCFVGAALVAAGIVSANPSAFFGGLVMASMCS